MNDLAANQGKLVGQLAAIRANATEQFQGLLNPQQLQKLKDLHAGGQKS